MFIFSPLYVVLAEHYLIMQKNVLAFSNSVSAIKSNARINVNSHCQVSECYVAREGRLCCQCFGRFQAEFLCLCKTVVFVWHFQWRWECCVASLIASMQWKSDLQQMFEKLPAFRVISRLDSFFLVMSMRTSIRLVTCVTVLSFQMISKLSETRQIFLQYKAAQNHLFSYIRSFANQLANTNILIFFFFPVKTFRF